MKELYKISHQETTYLINQIREIIDDNEALESLFDRYFPAQDAVSSSQPLATLAQNTLSIPSWFNTIFPYPFSKNDMLSLGIGEISNAKQTAVLYDV
jgi:hypothetical protein